MKTLKEHKAVLEGVLCMDAWGVFIIGAVIAILGIYLENTNLMGWGLGIILTIGVIMGFFITKHLEDKRAFIVNKGFLVGKLK